MEVEEKHFGVKKEGDRFVAWCDHCKLHETFVSQGAAEKLLQKHVASWKHERQTWWRD